MIRIAHGKEATQITVFRTCSALKVSQQADGIFFLEIDIHHIRLVVLTLLAKEFAVLAILVVYLYLLDGIGGKILQHDLLVASEEILAVEQQILNKLAVVIDASIFLDFHTRHLPDQGIKHTALCQNKGIGVIDNSISLMIKLHLTSYDIYLLQHLRIRAQHHWRKLPQILPLPQVTYGNVDIRCLIAQIAGTNDIVSLYSWHVKLKDGGITFLIIPGPMVVRHQGFNNRAV